MGKGLSERTGLLVLALHLAALLGGVVFSGLQWSDVAAQRAAVDQSRAVIAQLDARLARSPPRQAAAAPAADPFLQGGSVTVAGANLQDLVVSAIRTAGGTVNSSQIDTTGASATPPVLLLTVSCQLAHPALQTLLYALEAGTPALFVDELSIDTGNPEAGGGAPGNGVPLKISMTVSAYWNGDHKS